MDLPHDNIFSVGPIFNGKMLDVKWRSFSGDTIVDRTDSRQFVCIEPSETVRWVSDFRKTAQRY